MKILVAAVILLCAGCTPPPQSTPPPARECDAAAAAGLVGAQGSPRLAREAQRMSRAAMVRVLRPGQMVTMEYRADRLNIRVDGQGKVLAITCG